MKLAYLFAAMGLAGSTCLAQEICGIPKHGPSADAVASFEKIAEAVGIRPGTILLYASSDQLVRDRSGALSVECPGGRGEERWIVYDPQLIKGDGIYFALAHETAHHLNNDPMSGERPSRELELRADEYAARYLMRPPLNWTSERLVEAINALPLPSDAIGLYPSVAERRAQVNAGYTSESAHLHPNTQPTPIGNIPSASVNQDGEAMFQTIKDLLEGHSILLVRNNNRLPVLKINSTSRGCVLSVSGDKKSKYRSGNFNLYLLSPTDLYQTTTGEQTSVDIHTENGRCLKSGDIESAWVRNTILAVGSDPRKGGDSLKWALATNSNRCMELIYEKRGSDVNEPTDAVRFTFDRPERASQFVGTLTETIRACAVYPEVKQYRERLGIK